MANTPFRKFRADDELWAELGRAVAASPDGEADRSAVIRQFIRWYVGRPGAQLPQRAVDYANAERPTPTEDRASSDGSPV